MEVGADIVQRPARIQIVAEFAAITGVVNDATVRNAWLLGAAPAGTAMVRLLPIAGVEVVREYITGPPLVLTVRLMATAPGQITTP